MKTFTKFQKVTAFFLLLCFVLLIQPSRLWAENTNLIIPKDKVISVELLDDLNSATNKNGDKVIFETREKIIIDDVVVIPYGTKGTGTVEEVHPAGHWGKGGYFKINFGSLKSINDVEIPIEIGKSAQGAQQAAGVILPVVSLVFFWPLAFFGFTKGKEAQIPKGTQMFVNTRNEVDLGITPEQALETYGDSVLKDMSTTDAPKSAETQRLAVKSDPAKTEQLPFTITNALVCKGISEDGDPIGINSVFYQKVKSLGIWCSFENLESDTMLESKWYHDKLLIKTKQLIVYKDKHQDFVSGTVIFPDYCQPGSWRVELRLNNQVLKNLAFKIK